eukprot:COSAG06_NODE_60196_length_271_cov_1.505814_1_plen_36_part_10
MNTPLNWRLFAPSPVFLSDLLILSDRNEEKEKRRKE